MSTILSPLSSQPTSPLRQPTKTSSSSPTLDSKADKSRLSIPSPLKPTKSISTFTISSSQLRRPTVHSRSKSYSSVSPPPDMQRSNSLPSPSQRLPPSPQRFNITTTPTSPTYRNSFVPTFTPLIPTFIPSSTSKRTPITARTPPPQQRPKTPPSYLTTELFPGSNPPSLSSTPTSSRSCSPSVYSIEEEEEPEVNDEDDVVNLRESVGLGIGVKDKEKRKRWSVCGAERRCDLDLETIWED